MAEFRWLAPIIVPFTSRPGIRDRAPDSYREILQELDASIGDQGWTIPRLENSHGSIGWTSASGDELPWRLEVIEGTVRPDALRPLEGLRPVTTSWALHDHQVMLIEGTLATLDDAPVRPEDAERWEGAVQTAGRLLARQVAAEVLDRLITDLDAIEGADVCFDVDRDQINDPLWVTRAFQADPSREEDCAFARAWVAGIDDEHNRWIEDLIDGSRPSVARWLNHVHSRAHAAAVGASWTALRRAQFIWTAMHAVDERLRKILSLAMGDLEGASLSELRHDLRSTVDCAHELLMVHDEIRQRAGRASNTEMHGFLAFWEFDDVLERPVREKVNICSMRLSSLAEERAARSGMFTDIILMCIGVTSVLATAIALVQFGRDASTDPDQTPLDLGSSITAWFSSQSMDSILILSCLTSVVLVLVFVWKRRQSLS